MISHESLDRMGLGSTYRAVVGVCARSIAAVPSLEGAFVRLSRALWSTPVVGRFCRSVGYKFAERLHEKADVYREITVSAMPFQVDVSHWMFSGQYLGNVEYEPATGHYLIRHLQPGGVFVDVGANSGYFSLLAARRVGPEGRVFAFEPNPPVYESLVHHVKLNGFGDRVRLFACALSDAATDTARLHVTPMHSGFSSLEPETAPGAQHLAGGESVTVRTETFDDWLARDAADVATIDLIKIDVEGFERHVVSGMRGALTARRIARVVCETEWDSPAHRLLVGHGYVPEALETIGLTLNIAYECPARPSGSLPPTPTP